MGGETRQGSNWHVKTQGKYVRTSVNTSETPYDSERMCTGNVCMPSRVTLIRYLGDAVWVSCGPEEQRGRHKSIENDLQVEQCQAAKVDQDTENSLKLACSVGQQTP